MKKELIKLANYLNKVGLRKEAGYLDNIIKKYAEEEPLFDEGAFDLAVTEETEKANPWWYSQYGNKPGTVAGDLVPCPGKPSETCIRPHGSKYIHYPEEYWKEKKSI